MNDLKKNNEATFVTVINVSSKENDNDTELQQQLQRLPKRDSLRSVSSPTTPPTSPLISSSTEDFISREGLAAVNTSSISSSSAASSSKEPLADLDEDIDQVTEDIFRGQPDGRDDENKTASGVHQTMMQTEQPNENETNNRTSVRELMSLCVPTSTGHQHC